MKQLHPRAYWLFFFRAVVICLVLSWMFSWVLAPILYFAIRAYGITDLGVVAFVGGFTVLFQILFVIVVSHVYARLSYRYYKYELTDIGFKKEHGVIWKKYITIPYDRIQNIDIYRGILARLLGLSDLQIQTAGGITSGSYGAFSEGRLMGVSMADAELIREELVRRMRSMKGQGL